VHFVATKALGKMSMLCCVVISKEETMSSTREILETYPQAPDIETGELADALDALKDCAWPVP
jgi:hypothetical protein